MSTSKASFLNIKTSKAGISLLEIILAITISLTLALFTGTSWIQYFRRQKVETVATNIASLLQDTRNRAITAENGFTYGIRVVNNTSPTSLEIIESNNGDSWSLSSTHASRRFNVPTGIQITGSTGLSNTASNPEIHFEKRSGNAILTEDQGQITISDSLYQMQLNISPTGNFTLSQIEKIN